jgi:DNA-directed RNA polymerase subunit E'/Rpb7
MNSKNSDLYVTNILDYRYHLNADELGYDPDEIFLAKLKKEIEGRCIKEGYVKNNSIKILSRTIGKINQAYFTGLPVYDIKYQADVCNPPIGSIITCFVKDITKMGVICTINDGDNPLDIVVPSQLHFNNKKYTMLEPDMKIQIKVLNKRHENADNCIQIMGILETTPFDEDKNLNNNTDQPSQTEEDSESDDSDSESDSDSDKDDDKDVNKDKSA